MANELGRRIKRLREEHLLSRKDLAGILKCSISHAINIEKGNAGLSDEKKKLLATHFNTPKKYFDIDIHTDSLIDSFDYQIGQNIKQLRKQHNLTQTEFAEEIGYSGSAAVSAFESGKRSVSKKKLVEMADFFGVHIAELFRTDKTSYRNELEYNKLISDFFFLIESDVKPPEFDSIEKLIATSCKKIRSNAV